MATAGRSKGTRAARPWLRPDEVRSLKSGTAVEVEWYNGDGGRYELEVDARGSVRVAREDGRGGRSENRCWMPVALTLGDKIRLAG